MRTGSVYNAANHSPLVDTVWRTNNMLERIRGLLGRPALLDGQGLWIEPCPSVHTIGMRYPIDVVFLDQAGVVQKIAHELRPVRFAGCTLGRSALELNGGFARKINLKEGMQLVWKKAE